MHWFDEARFGMFIHWSHCSQAGLEVSWPLVGGGSTLPYCQDVPAEEYHALAATFAPTPATARDWARLAKAAGMRYAVMTARHHDGFAMFETRFGAYSVMQSPCRRDLVREYVDAFREAGLRIGFYYSLSDWHHADYPPLRDEHRPYSWGRRPAPSPAQWARFQEYLEGQLRELLTNYGTIDLLWFDGGWERSPEQWRTERLMALVRSLQPAILVNDRLPGAGDFATPEQFIPSAPPAGRWETCLTMNESWGWNPADRSLKSAHEIVHALIEVASRGGNLLLNVSPTGDGSLPAWQVERLGALERWMSRNTESIHGTGPGLEPWQFHGPTTRRGDRVYLHCLARPYESVTVRGVPVRRLAAVTALADQRPLASTVRIPILDQLRRATDPLGEVRIAIPADCLDEFATVIALDFAPAEG